MKMNPKSKPLWLTALRSDEYTQIKVSLETQDGNCCMGVLCREAIKHGIKLDVGLAEKNLEGMFLAVRSFNNQINYPPHAVKEWAGIISDEKDQELIDVENPLRKLAYMNDEGKSFKEIADYIEANL